MCQARNLSPQLLLKNQATYLHQKCQLHPHILTHRAPHAPVHDPAPQSRGLYAPRAAEVGIPYRPGMSFPRAAVPHAGEVGIPHAPEVDFPRAAGHCAAEVGIPNAPEVFFPLAAVPRIYLHVEWCHPEAGLG